MSDDMAKVIRLFKEESPESGEQAGEVQLTQMQKMNALWEASFVRYGQTLTDPTAVKSLKATLAMADTILNGACATGVINEEQRDMLRTAIRTGLSAANDFQGLS